MTDIGEQSLRKIIVIGSPGSGKSTFSRKLRDKTELPLYYLDTIFHNPDRTTVSREEFDHSLSEIRHIHRSRLLFRIRDNLPVCHTVLLPVTSGSIQQFDVHRLHQMVSYFFPKSVFLASPDMPRIPDFSGIRRFSHIRLFPENQSLYVLGHSSLFSAGHFSLS